MNGDYFIIAAAAYYFVQTYIPGESIFEDLSTGDETTEDNLPGTSAPEAPTTTENGANSDPDGDRGCSSAFILLSPVMLILVGGAWVMKKKDN